MIKIITMALIPTSITLGVLFMIFIAPVMLYKGICMITYDEISGSDKICQYIPVLNLFRIEMIYTQVYGGRGTFFVFPISSALLTLSVFLRLFQVFFMPLAVQAGLYTIYAVILFIIIAYGSNVWLVHNILDEDTRVFGLKRTIYHIIPMLASYYICMDLSIELHKIKESEAAIG